MTVDQDSLSLAEAPVARSAAMPGMHPLQQAALRISDYRESKGRLKAKDLVGLLLCHGARAWRASQPVAAMRLRVSTPAGSRAIRIRLR